MWYVDKEKQRAVESCADEEVACGKLKGVWAGPLWLLFAYAGKKLNMPCPRPINIERLVIEYGRCESGLVKNLTSAGLYEPIVVIEAEFVPWVVRNWEKILMTEVEGLEEFDEAERPRKKDHGLARPCYVRGDESDIDMDGLDMLCYVTGGMGDLSDADLGIDPNTDVFGNVLSKFKPGSEEKESPTAEEKKPEEVFEILCYRPIDPENERRHPIERGGKKEPEKKK